MAKIPLRMYCKDVENLIERGEIEQAISHAKNILRAYPKHLETYRLLGKAYLESQRYGEASDILQRVLSVIPDDFFAQIGMSIIREDEGNLDASIWHMERAYEVQPFNPAVQDELRRLYGRRDGIEPPKIRLTRGALVRMYARGELYPQAIAEIRAALAEDPQRLDLRVLLARLYYLSGQKNDAAEVCSDLIGKLPYCYEANRLLAEILPTTSRASETPKFQARIYALDPYEAFISPSAPTSAQVPDQAVMVEQFMWDQAAEETRPPDWTRTAGVDWEESQEENLPDWLNNLKPDLGAANAGAAVSAYAATGAPAAEEPLAQDAGADLPTAEEDLIPDWMKEAGWAKSDRTADEIMGEQSIAEDSGASAVSPFPFAEAQPESDGEAAQGEIPEWLQAIAPPAAQDADEARSEWLEDILANPQESTRASTAEASSLPWDEMNAESAFSDAPAPGEDTAPEISPEADRTAVEDEMALPAWMAGFGAEVAGQEAESQPPASAAAQPTPTAEEENVPEWLKQLKSGEEIPSAESQPTAGTEFSTAADESEAETAELPDWLNAVAEQAPEGTAEMTPAASISAAGAPEWIAEEAAAPAQETELPEWLRGLGLEESAEQEVPAAPQEVAEHEVPAAEQEVPVVEDVRATASHLPEEVIGVADILPETQMQPEAESAGMPNLEDTGAVMAWLESLAAKQGADEATLLTRPEERSETPPEWVTRQMEGAAETAVDPLAGMDAASGEAGSLEPAEQPQAQTPGAVVPEAQTPAAVETAGFDLNDEAAAMAWLESLAAKQGADEATLLTTPKERSETPPDWVMRELAQQDVVEPEAPLAEQAVVEQEVAEWEVPGYEMPLAQVNEPEEPEFSEAQAPDQQHAPQPPAASQAEVATPDMADMDAAMAWLESLAAKQGADEETLLTRPEERSETPPDWVRLEPAVQDLAAQTPEPEAQEWELVEPDQTDEAAGQPLPDWLSGVELDAPAEDEGVAGLAQDRSMGWMGDLMEPESPEALRDLEMLDLAPDARIEDTEEALAAQAALEESPEWLKRLEVDEEPSASAAEEMPWSTEPAMDAPSAAPSGVEDRAGATSSAGRDLPEVDLPDWLKAAQEETAAPEPAAETAAPPASVAPEEQIPEWLMGLEEEMGADASETGEAIAPHGGEYRAAWEPELALDEEAQPSAASLPETAPPAEAAPQPAAAPEPAVAPPAWISPSGPGAIEALRAALNRGQIDEALHGYTRLIEQEQSLDEVIRDLRDALYRYPVDIDLWQTLGDAHARNNQLQEALDAYTKAEELLR